MKKIFFILLFLPLCLSAQTPKTTIASDNDSLSDTLPHRTSYQSVFGKNKTEWTIVRWLLYHSPVVSDKTDAFSDSLSNHIIFSSIFASCENHAACILEKDSAKYTVLTDSKNSRELSALFEVLRFQLRYSSDTFTYNGHSYTSVIGEDTIHGRLYRLYYDSIEVLWCDMSLMLGDTFRLPNVDSITHYRHPEDYLSYHGQGESWVVDSIYYLNGRKIIRFDFIQKIYSIKPWWYYNITLYFIEGIGPTYGPIGKLDQIIGKELPLLLCVYKDDTLDFMTSSAWGCDKNAGPGWYYDGAVKEPKRTTLTLQPNPAQDYILLRNEDASDLGGEIIITDAIGRVLRHCTMEDAEMSINTGSYSSGTYFVRYRSQNGVQILKFVKAE